VRRAAAEAAAPPPARSDSFIRIIATAGDEGDVPARHRRYVLALPRGLHKAGYTDLRGELREEQVADEPGEIDWIRHAPEVKIAAPTGR
jgi:hypothetical protein